MPVSLQRPKVMKVIKLFLMATVFALSCQPSTTDAELREEVLEADRNFSKMAGEKGIAEAFIYYADEKVIKPTPGKQPVVGKFALMEWYEQNPPGDEKLIWEPLRAEASGNLGYTFGGYELHTKTQDGLRDTVFYGNYVSVWKRKSDGNWRYVIDTGNATDGPVSLKK
jgi:ketosteroid isomerase-like protein